MGPSLERPSLAMWRLFWASVWLAVLLVAVKASYLGLPHSLIRGNDSYLRSLAAISYTDVLFVGVAWACGRVALMLAGRRQRAASAVTFIFVALGAFSCLYVVANVIMFGLFGGYLTYPLVALIGDVRMVRSSVAEYLTPQVVMALVGVPVGYVLFVEVMVRWMSGGTASRLRRHGAALAALGVWVVFGHYAFAASWATRQDRHIAENAHWVFVSSWWEAVAAENRVRIAERFPAADLADFEPIGMQPQMRSAMVLGRTLLTGRHVRTVAPRRAPNVILIVLESVAARWTSIGGSSYETTPALKTESSSALVFDNFYAHVGRSSNSLAAILLSTFPKIGFRDLTEEYPRLSGTSLAGLFRDRGYRTAFITPSDLNWAGWSTFIESRGFAAVRDYRSLSCSEALSSWGVEDRCMIDGMVDFIGEDATRPFFLMGWTQQTHHPYEPTPGVALLDLVREHGPDDYDLGRYLNVLHETDRHLARLFDKLRDANLEDDTLVVVTGDHGQAFGHPHDSYMQGRNIYEEDVHVPLMLWFPRTYRAAARSKVVGSHVDLAPTIAELADLPAAPDWQGRSLLDPQHAPRAYFYVAEDQFKLGVREDSWKYIFNLREGTEELFDLSADPTEQHNLAGVQPERSTRFRQRLAAWAEANQRKYGQTVAKAGN